MDHNNSGEENPAQIKPKSDVHNSSFPDASDEINEINEPEDKRVLRVISRQFMAMISGRSNPLLDKISPEHITEILNNSRRQDFSDKIYNVIILCICLAFLVFLIVYLQSQKDLLEKVILAFLSFAAGFGVGKFKK
jgi:hypothetical protein